MVLGVSGPGTKVSSGIGFKIKGDAAIKRKMKKMPLLMSTYVMPTLARKVAIEATIQAQRNITSGGNNYTGKMRANLVPRFYRKSPGVWDAAISQQSPDKYTRVQEFGSYRPWYPPFSKIFKWGKFKGISSATGKVGRPPNIENLDPNKNALAFKGSKIFGVWNKLGKKGIKGKFFSTRAMAAIAIRMRRENWLGKIFDQGFTFLGGK